MVVISKRTVVALIGGHYIYHCEDTSMYSVTTTKVENPTEEQRFVRHFRFFFNGNSQHLQTYECLPSS